MPDGRYRELERRWQAAPGDLDTGNELDHAHKRAGEPGASLPRSAAQQLLVRVLRRRMIDLLRQLGMSESADQLLSPHPPTWAALVAMIQFVQNHARDDAHNAYVESITAYYDQRARDRDNTYIATARTPEAVRQIARHLGIDVPLVPHPEPEGGS